MSYTLYDPFMGTIWLLYRLAVYRNYGLLPKLCKYPFQTIF